MKEIRLSQEKSTFVDDEDYEELSKYKWHVSKIGGSSYDCRNVKINNKTTIVRMHVVIMKPPKGRVVDHLDWNGLNNTRSNLRVVTCRQNSRNRRVRNSKYPGVYKVDHDGKKERKRKDGSERNNWYSIIKYNGKWIYVGSFKTEEETYTAYMRKCIELGLD